MSEPELPLQQSLEQVAQRVLDGLAPVLSGAELLEAMGRGTILAAAGSVVAAPEFAAVADDLALLAHHASTREYALDSKTGALHELRRYRRELAASIPRQSEPTWAGITAYAAAIGLAHAAEIYARTVQPSGAREALAILMTRSTDGATVSLKEVRTMLDRSRAAPTAAGPP